MVIFRKIINFNIDLMELWIKRSFEISIFWILGFKFENAIDAWGDWIRTVKITKLVKNNEHWFSEEKINYEFEFDFSWFAFSQIWIFNHLFSFYVCFWFVVFFIFS